MPERNFLIVCGPRTSVPAGWRKWPAKRVNLDTTHGVGNVNVRMTDITLRMVADLPGVAEDLVRLSAYVYAADQACGRGTLDRLDYGLAWRRRFRFVVPVRCPEVWRDPAVLAELTRTLSFLSDDDYEFAFVPVRTGGWQDFLEFDDGAGFVPGVEEVMLFSGGLDSLAGAVREVLVDRRRVALVSHRPVTKIDSRQQGLARALAERARPGAVPFHVPVQVNKKEHLGRDFAQRTRSFLFVSLATVVARLFGLDRVRFYENGIVSCNLPVCAQVIGGRASRTTHPRVLAGFARLMSLLFDGRPFAVENPFLLDTRTEIVERLRASGHANLTALSASCAHTWQASTDQPHCGTCSQCVDRRLAVLAARLTDAEDPAERYRADLLTSQLTDVLDQTMVERIVGTAREVEAIGGPESFVQRFGEAARLLRYVGGTADEAAVKLFDLHRRHARQVNDALGRELSTWFAGGRWHELGPNCLLRMLAPAARNAGDTVATQGSPSPAASPSATFAPTPEDVAILEALATANRTMYQSDLEEHSDVSRRTVYARLRELLRWKLIHYPHGARKGAAITDPGREALRLASRLPPRASA